ncbi:MAG: MalY/PatB family protein [Brevefilum sp.]
MDFDQVIDRRKTESIKWNHFDEDVLPMWVADMDFRSPQTVIDALHDRVDHGIFGYGGPPEGLRSAIIQHLDNRHHWQIEPRAIEFISGVVTGFTHAIYSLTDPGDKVLIQTPAYPPFLAAPVSTGRDCVINELLQTGDGRYEIDFDDFEAKIASGVKLFILCNPQNPTGRVFRHEELLRMAEICLAHGTQICSDEIHADLIYPGERHIPIASLSSEISQNTVTYFAPSKTFNLAGFSTSVYVTENPDMQKTLSKSMRMLLGHPNILGLYAAHAAYKDGSDWLNNLMVYLQDNRDFLAEFVANKLDGIRMWKPEGTYLGWLDCRDLDLSVSPQKFFLEEARVGLNDGADFGKAGQGFVRLNFGCPRKILEAGMSRIKTALENRN